MSIVIDLPPRSLHRSSAPGTERQGVRQPGAPEVARAAEQVIVGETTAGLCCAVLLATPAFWLSFIVSLFAGASLLAATMIGFSLGALVLVSVALFAAYCRGANPAPAGKRPSDDTRPSGCWPEEWLASNVARPIKPKNSLRRSEPRGPAHTSYPAAEWLGGGQIVRRII